MKLQEFDLGIGEGIAWETQEGRVAIYVVDLDEQTGEAEFLIDFPRDGDFRVELAEGAWREFWGTPQCKGAPRFWLLFSVVLSHKVRREVFMPLFNEFVEDYLFAKNQTSGKWEKRWLSAAFTVKTLGVVRSCLGMQFGTVLVRLWRWLLLLLSFVFGRVSK